MVEGYGLVEGVDVAQVVQLVEGIEVVVGGVVLAKTPSPTLFIQTSPSHYPFPPSPLSHPQKH